MNTSRPFRAVETVTSGADAVFCRDEAATVDDTAASRSSVVQVKVVTDRIYRTVCLYVCFGVLGLASPLLGNTIVHLERLFDTDTATMSLTFTVHMIGYLAGSVVCGFVFDSVNHEIAFTVSCFIQGLATIAAPLIGEVGGLVAFMGTICVQATSQGFIDAAGQSYSVGLWEGHRYREPVLQGAHALWSLGGTIGPFIIALFLVELPHRFAYSSMNLCGDAEIGFSSTINTPSSSFDTDNLTSSSGVFTTSLSSNISAFASCGPDDVDVAKVRYAYIAIGSLILVSSLLYVVAYLRGRSRRVEMTVGKSKKSKLPPAVKTVEQKSPEEGRGNGHAAVSSPVQATESAASRPDTTGLRTRFTFAAFIALIFLFYLVYLLVEMIPIAFLTTFSIKYLNFSVQNASLLMSVFFGFHFAGRALGIPLSTFLRPRTMVLVDLSMTAVAYLMLLAFVNVWPAIVWPSAALAGLSMATTFATAVLWVADRIEVTGRVASILIVGTSTGGIIGPYFVGSMLESSTPMWFVYSLVASSLGHVVLFVGMLAFVGSYGDLLKPTPVVDAVVRSVGGGETVVTFVDDGRDRCAVATAVSGISSHSIVSNGHVNIGGSFEST